MNFNKILRSLFGDKSSRDMKLIQPLVEKVKAAYPLDSRNSAVILLKSRITETKVKRDCRVVSIATASPFLSLTGIFCPGCRAANL